MDCCRSGRDAAPRSRAGAVRAAVEWAVPLTVLALTPKCPACVAAYAMLFAGVGVSLSAAAYLRWALLASCGIVLACLIVRSVRFRTRRAAAA